MLLQETHWYTLVISSTLSISSLEDPLKYYKMENYLEYYVSALSVKRLLLFYKTSKYKLRFHLFQNILDSKWYLVIAEHN